MEKVVATRILQKFISRQGTAHPLLIFSVVAQDHLKGYIYVEARRENHVREVRHAEVIGLWRDDEGFVVFFSKCQFVCLVCFVCLFVCLFCFVCLFVCLWNFPFSPIEAIDKMDGCWQQKVAMVSLDEMVQIMKVPKSNVRLLFEF
jgi:hypothetical protein